MKQRRVAVIGAGPGGLVAARYLKSEQFEAVIFEQGERIGGQWSGDAAHSGVWPGMRTNTSRSMTAFSDLPHCPNSSTYLTGEAMGEYLQRYADLFALTPRVGSRTAVRGVRRSANRGWIVRTDGGEERFRQVVIAGGLFNMPSIPNVSGLSSFSGCRGAIHAFSDKTPET